MSGSREFLEPGPWGRVERVPILLSPPLDFAAYFHNELTHFEWHFPGLDRSGVEGLLQQFGFEPADRRRLLERLRTGSTNGTVELPVDANLVSDLPRDARERLYDWLSLHDSNVSHANAFRFRGDLLDDWFRKSPLQDSTIEWIKERAYRRGPFWVFADLPLLSQRFHGDELSLAIKVLSREATCLLKLHVAEEDSAAALAEYWGFGKRNKDIGPLLESLKFAPGEQMIDVVHLLPPFARRLLFTYPRPRSDGLDHRRDCHWTSMNFFREAPDDQFTDLAFVADVIQTRMTSVASSELRPGDIAIFFANDHEAIHSAVYIADNMLFTKNGPAYTRPWMFMPLEEMRHFYTQGRPQTVQYYRWLDLC